MDPSARKSKMSGHRLCIVWLQNISFFHDCSSLIQCVKSRMKEDIFFLFGTQSGCVYLTFCLHCETFNYRTPLKSITVFLRAVISESDQQNIHWNTQESRRFMNIFIWYSMSYIVWLNIFINPGLKKIGTRELKYFKTGKRLCCSFRLWVIGKEDILHLFFLHNQITW